MTKSDFNELLETLKCHLETTSDGPSLITILDQYAYITDTNARQLTVVDIRNPAAHYVVGCILLPGI